MYGWRMTGMNQSALEGFVKIVEHNSYSAAAEALYLSQSALSQQIRTLEGQLGVELLQHVPRRVVLTPAGQDFYPRAKQMVALYNDAVRHARAVQHRADPPARHLEIAYHHDAMRMFGYDLLALTRELSLTYSPILHGCATRSELWRSLKKGELDLSFQLDNAEIYAHGLKFTPLFYVPEFCVPFHAPESMPLRELTLEQALEYRWMPANHMDQNFYEAALLQEGMRRGASIIPIGTAKSAQYNVSSLKFVPGIYYRRPDLSFVRVLVWNHGHRFGMVTRPDADAMVAQYIQELQRQLPPLSKKLLGMELEAIQE